MPFPNKISCFVSTCVSLDNSFPSVSFPVWGPGRYFPFQQHKDCGPGELQVLCIQGDYFIRTITYTLQSLLCLPPASGRSLFIIHGTFHGSPGSYLSRCLPSQNLSHWKIYVVSSAKLVCVKLSIPTGLKAASAFNEAPNKGIHFLTVLKQILLNPPHQIND